MEFMEVFFMVEMIGDCKASMDDDGILWWSLLRNTYGSCDGINEGELLGTDEGAFEGTIDGRLLGLDDGILEGTDDGW